MSSGKPLCAVVLMAAGALSSAALADSVFVGTLERKDVKILNFRNGVVEFSIAGRPVDPVAADKISRLLLEDDPAFSRAEQAYAEGKWALAAESYQPLLKTPAKPWLADWILPRLIESADRAGRFDTASAAFVQLLRKDPATAARLRPSAPANAPAPMLAAAASELSKSAGSAALPPAQQQAILGLLLDTHIAQGDLPAASTVAQQLTKGLPAESTDPAIMRILASTRIAIAKLALAQKDYAKALAEIQQHRTLFTEPQQQAQSLYCIALARDGQAGDKPSAETAKDLALDYMRFAAAARQTPDKRHLAESLLRTAELQESLGEPRIALALYAEVAAEYKDSPLAAKAAREQQRLKEKSGM